MRKKLPAEQKRSNIIGVKVQLQTRKQLEYIAKREAETLSTTIDKILRDYINNYFEIAKIDKNNLPNDGIEKT